MTSPPTICASSDLLAQTYAALLAGREDATQLDSEPKRARETAEPARPFVEVRVHRDSYLFELNTLDDMHFLDWHACTLLKRMSRKAMLVMRDAPPAHILNRIAAGLFVSDGENRERLISHWLDTGGELRMYHPGALLARFLHTPGWSRVWRDYLTSRDTPPRISPAGATLDGKFPHLRAGFLTGIDLFHQGSFYQAHEDWESLWMRLDEHDARQNIERHAAQGLIQLSGAHLHRLKGRHAPAVKLFRAAANNLTRAMDLEWLDTPALLAASTRIFDNCRSPEAALDPIVIPFIPLKYADIAIARKHR